MRQVFVKVSPGDTVVPSAMVTSSIYAALSHTWELLLELDIAGAIVGMTATSRVGSTVTVPVADGVNVDAGVSIACAVNEAATDV